MQKRNYFLINRKVEKSMSKKKLMLIILSLIAVAAVA